MSPRYLTLQITPELDGTEVNTLLRRVLGLSGTVLRRVKWLPDGITLDGTRVHVRVRAAEGQTLSVRLTDPERKSGIVPRQGPLDIVFEDRDLVVVNKAAGVSVHPGPGHYDDTLGNFLIYYYDLEGEPADFHPVHRLDRGTTGLLAAAKNAWVHDRLQLTPGPSGGGIWPYAWARRNRRREQWRCPSDGPPGRPSPGGRTRRGRMRSRITGSWRGGEASPWWS